MKRSSRNVFVIALVGALSACVAGPPARPYTEAPVRPARLVVYPAQGQSPQQLERDRYECHVWAVRQSGFDPSAPGADPTHLVRVEPATPPGANTAAGVVVGAIIGSVIAGPRDSGLGAVAGAVMGGAVGANADANAQARAGAVEQHINDRALAEADGYRRAISACLVARGYTIS